MNHNMDNLLNQKDVSERELVSLARDMRLNHQSLVAVHGCFDHVDTEVRDHLAKARTHGDRLVAIVHNPEPGVEMRDLMERMQDVAQIDGVDWVLVCVDPSPQRALGLISAAKVLNAEPQNLTVTQTRSRMHRAPQAEAKVIEMTPQMCPTQAMR